MEVQVSELPSPVFRATTEEFYEFLAIHRPEPGNEAHSQVELTTAAGHAPKRVNEDFRKDARSKLAAVVRVRGTLPPAVSPA